MTFITPCIQFSPENGTGIIQILEHSRISAGRCGGRMSMTDVIRLTAGAGMAARPPDWEGIVFSLISKVTTRLATGPWASGATCS